MIGRILLGLAMAISLVEGLAITGSLAPLERFLLRLDDQLPERCEVADTEAARESFQVAGLSRIPEEPEDRSGSWRDND